MIYDFRCEMSRNYGTHECDKCGASFNKKCNTQKYCSAGCRTIHIYYTKTKPNKGIGSKWEARRIRVLGK
jgi:hypothetical protein